ncbi:MAG: hypothetical protein AVDCRST_MAG35-384, partial [uncultured Quadrisphaera sp.]
MSGVRGGGGGDRYGGWATDVLAAGAPSHRPRRPSTTAVPAERGLVVEDVETGWCGA